MSQFSFQYPFVLLLILFFVVCAKYCKESSRAIFFPHVEKLIIKNKKSLSFLTLLKWLGIISVVIALASPVITKSYTNIKKEGRDIVLIVDSSASMKKSGFDLKNPSRSKFDVIKDIIADFIEKREYDRIGMITFADIAFIASPLTFEKRFLRDIAKMQKLGIAGKKTAINDAIVQSYSMLSKSKAKSKIAILLTDGVDNVSKVSFEDTKHMIEERDIKLYTIGIGGSKDYDSKYLKTLAKAGKGEASAARSAAMLDNIYNKINKLEVTKLDHKKIVEQTHLYIYPLYLAFLSLMLFIYYRNTKGV